MVVVVVVCNNFLFGAEYKNSHAIDFYKKIDVIFEKGIIEIDKTTKRNG